MSSEVLDRLRAERDQCRDTALALVEADDYDPNSEALKNLEERGSSLDAQIERLVKLTEQRQAADALDGKLARASHTRQRQEQPETRDSWGEAFVRSDIFRNYHSGSSPVFELDDAETRALPTGIADLVAAGFKGTPTQVDVSANPAPTPLMDNIGQIQVSGNGIEFIAWSKKAGGAAKVAEKAGKPSVEYGPTVTSTTLDTFAAHTQLTRQLIEDFAAVRSIIDTELRREVARAEEADAAAVLAAASGSIPDVTNAELLASIRMGVGTVQAAGYAPSAVLLNPADWAELDISVMGGTLRGPTVGTNFWGLTPVPSNAQPAGTAIVGDFRTGVTHYFRAQIALYVTDSHADTFLSNVFTLLAERRGKTAVVRPQALVECKTA